jgi:type I restriction enzyme S subunit
MIQNFASDTGRLPSGWSRPTIAQITQNYDGLRQPVKATDRASRQGTYPYYGASRIIDSVDDFLFDGTYLLIAEDGANLLSRSTPIAFKATGRFWVNNHAHIVQTTVECDLDYLRYYLNGLDIVQYVSGSAQPKLTQKALNRIPIPLPLPNEQRRIVAKLDSLLSNSKSAREELAHIPRLVERYRGALLAAAFRGDRSWRQTTLGALSTDVRYGTATKCHYEPKTTPVLRIPNVVNGRIDLSDLKYGSFSKQEAEKFALKAGDLLVIRANGSLDLVGRAALVPKKIAGHLFAGYLIRIRLDSRQVCPAFVQYVFDEPSIRKHIESLAKSTSGVNNINSEQLRSITLRIPSLEEQKAIVEKIQSAFSSIDHLRDEALRANALLDRLDQSTLAKAFRGELLKQETPRALSTG